MSKNPILKGVAATVAAVFLSTSVMAGGGGGGGDGPSISDYIKDAPKQKDVENVPIKNTFSDGKFITKSGFEYRKKTYSEEYGSGIRLLVLKFSSTSASDWHEGEVKKMAEKVSNLFPNDDARVAAILSAYPEKGMTNNGKPISGGIILYVNDQLPIMLFPKEFTQAGIEENVRLMSEKLFHAYDSGDYNLTREEYRRQIRESKDEEVPTFN